ncbi:MAG TPA: fibronectin type III domain-containing protein [Kiritimatiellia bacterium]|nr:fibronectin type III domain-containing protein [Kiritimatiellia bacterium]
MKVTRIAWSLVALLGAVEGAAGQHLFYVATNGSDANPGSVEWPLASLEGARNRVRSLFSTNGPLSGNVEVLFRPGEYLLTNNPVFTTQDSGRDGYRVIYRPEGDIGSVQFAGSPRLSAWTPHTNNIWKHLNVPGPVGSVYENGRRAWKARTPNRPATRDPQYPIHYGPYLNSEGGSHSSLVYKTGDLNPDVWTLTPGAEAVHWIFSDSIAKRRDWGTSVRSLLAADSTNRTLQLNLITATNGLIGVEDRYFIQGIYELLDQPGEFFHDGAAQTLYYIPRHSDPTQADIRAPTALTLMSVIGDIENLASNITFSGFTFRYTRYVGPEANTLYGLIRLQHAERIVIENCRIANAGSMAIMGQARLRHSTIRNCWIEQVGSGGIYLMNFYNRFTQPTNRLTEFNTVENCMIHDVGEEPIQPVYNGGVLLFNANHTRVEHGEIFNSPRYGITLRGHYTTENPVVDIGAHRSFNNEFSHLRIHRAGSDSGDMGAIHGASLSDPSDRATNLWEHLLVRDVYAHPSMLDHGPNGIFMDHPFSSEYQRFEYLDITRVQAEPFRGNRNSNQFFRGCSWLPDNDASLMHRSRVGLRHDFPFPRTAAYWPLDDTSITQHDQVGSLDLTTVQGINSGLFVAQPLPNPEPGPFRNSRQPDANFGSMLNPVLDGGVAPEAEMSDWHSFTFEGWLRVDTTPTQDMVLATTRHGPAFAPDYAYVGWYLGMNTAGRMFFVADNGPSIVSVVDTNSLIDGQWHHVAAVWDHDATPVGQLRLYIDGALAATAPGLGGLSQNNRFAIGARKTAAAPAVLDENRWNGRLDELRLSRAALSPDEFLNRAAPLAQPAALVASNITDTSATLTWEDRSAGADGFFVLLSTNDVMPATTTHTALVPSLTLTNLTPDTYHYVWVQAHQAGDASRSVRAVFRTPFALTDKPTALAASRAAGILELTWADTFNAETGFVVERATGSPTGFVEVAALPDNSTRAEFTWAFDTHYYFRVAATSTVDGIRSDWSATLHVPPWTAAEVPGLHLWLDATDFTNAGPIAVWPDKSPHAFHVAQTNPLLRPTVAPDSLNGHPVVRFALTNWMEITNVLAGRFESDPFTLITIHTSSAPANTVLAKGSFGAGGDWELGQQVDQFRWSSSNYLGRVRGDARVRTWSRTATDWRYYELGRLVSISSNNPTASFNNPVPLYLGRRGNAIANPLVGDIAEVIAIHGTLHPSNFVLLHAHLTAKWFPPNEGVITNAVVAPVTNVAATLHADVNAFLTNYEVRAYWGVTDGWTNPSAWNAVSPVLVLTDTWSRIHVAVSNLLPGRQYFYAVRASNPQASTWTPAGTTFITPAAGDEVTARGIPYWWWRNVGVTNDFAAHEDGDEDGDGVTGWAEFLSGTNPTNPASHLRLTGYATANGMITLEWFGGRTGAQRPWSLYRGTDPAAADTWTLIASNSIPNTADPEGINRWSLPLDPGSTTNAVLYHPAVLP